MIRHFSRAMWTGVFALAIAVGGIDHCARAQAPAASGEAAVAWTREEAIAHLRLFPRDVYMQYVALQLGRREGRLAETAAEIEQLSPTRNRFANRREQMDLFSIFSGSLAVQESLQLDAMTVDNPVAAAVAAGDAPPDAQSGRTGPLPLEREPTAPAVDSVAVSELEGPTIKSHPWTEMLAGRTPAVSGLALQTPSDFYFVSFRSVNKLIETADLTNLWGAYALSQSNHDAQTQRVNERLRTQLAIEVTPALRPFYDAVIDEVAIVGSDLFVREGSDVTLLFHAKQPKLLRVQMDRFLAGVESGGGDVVRSSGQYLGVDYEHVATPDRRVHVYSAYPLPDLHVRSNSQAALERVLEAIAGRDAGGAPIQRLGETEEFRYVRTLLPQGEAEEDGLVYLSDPFVRQLMSPGLRLTERRRMVCYNNLRMIGHAGLMHRTETGKSAESLDDLTKADCTPGVFGEGNRACPEHGEYSLAADGVTGVCSRHGYAHSLTPCLEITATHVSEAEADAYRQFVTAYNNYWRQFFDPIAIRLQITPERYRVETIVLPLIDNTIYTGLARALAGPTEPLDALPAPRRNIFSFAVRLNKEQMLRDWGLEQLLKSEPDEAVAAVESTRRASDALKQLALGMQMYHENQRQFPPAASRDAGGRPLLSWRVHLLPFIEQQELYGKFHLDEPWDSEHNRTLIALMPALFAGDDKALVAAGKTRFLVPRGEFTVFPLDGREIAFKSITDGSSNTAMLVEADDLHATIWTKPDDLDVDLERPYAGLLVRPEGATLMATCDGSTLFLRPETEAAVAAALFTRAGEELTDGQLQIVNRPNGYRGGPFRGVADEMFYKLQLGEFLTKGIGDQIGFHVYDCEPMFDLSMSQFLGLLVGNMRGSGLNDEVLYIAPLIGAFNGPVYLSIPVKDEQIVDGFLDRLDKAMVQAAGHDEFGFFFEIEQEFYHLPPAGERPVRGYTFRLGPLKWRFFWSRIGGGLYIASKREVLDDIAQLNATGGEATNASTASTVGHGMIRLRPQNWDRVLATYRLGWEENNREACLRNTGPLASLSRALAAGRPGGAGEVTAEELMSYTARVYDVHPFCPDGGEYHATAGGLAGGTLVSCTEHGSILEPRQGVGPSGASDLGALTASLRDVTVTLEFLEDGLHATATIERAPATE